MGTFNVLDASGNPQSVTNNGNGRQAAASSAPVALSTEDKASLDAITTAITDSAVAVGTAGTPDAAVLTVQGINAMTPLAAGTQAEDSLATSTMATAGNRVIALSDLDGALLVRGQFPFSDLISERTTNTDGNPTAFSNFGATASTRSYVFGYSIFRTDAGTTPIYLDFRDGTGGSVLWSVVIPPNGGAHLASPVPLFRTTANTALAYDVSAATSTVYISVTGCKSKV